MSDKLAVHEGLKLTGRWRLTARAKSGKTIVKEGKHTILPDILPELWRFHALRFDVFKKSSDDIILEGENLIATIGKNLIGWMLIDTSGYDTGLTYCAIGTGLTAPAVTDTGLTTEKARKAVTTKSINANTHEITFSTFLTAAEATYYIYEAGMFGHSTATNESGSGILFSHWLVTFDNSGGVYDITLDYILTID